MKKLLTRDGSFALAPNEARAASLQAEGWVEVNAPPPPPTPVTREQRRAQAQARGDVQQLEAQLLMDQQAARLQDECEASDLQWYAEIEQNLARVSAALQAREDYWVLQETCQRTDLDCLKRQLTEAVRLAQRCPHPQNAWEVSRLRSAIRAMQPAEPIAQDREWGRVQDERASLDRQRFQKIEQNVVKWTATIAVREDRWELEQACATTAQDCLKRQLIDAMTLQERHPHPLNALAVARLRAEIKSNYVRMADREG
jgi:hypothetical protein